MPIEVKEATHQVDLAHGLLFHIVKIKRKVANDK